MGCQDRKKRQSSSTQTSLKEERKSSTQRQILNWRKGNLERMKKREQRLLSWLLAVVMVLSMLPAGAFAAEADDLSGDAAQTEITADRVPVEEQEDQDTEEPPVQQEENQDTQEPPVEQEEVNQDTEEPPVQEETETSGTEETERAAGEVVQWSVDTETRGNWTDKYGKDGYVLCAWSGSYQPEYRRFASEDRPEWNS